MTPYVIPFLPHVIPAKAGIHFSSRHSVLDTESRWGKGAALPLSFLPHVILESFAHVKDEESQGGVVFIHPLPLKPACRVSLFRKG